MAILSVNAGSSSLKFSLHRFHDHHVDSAWVSGCLQGLEPGGTPSLDWSRDGQSHHEVLSVDQDDGFTHALQRLRTWLRDLPGMPPLRAIAHRVVHGGAEFAQAIRVTPDVMDRLARLNSLAPGQTVPASRRSRFPECQGHRPRSRSPRCARHAPG